YFHFGGEIDDDVQSDDDRSRVGAESPSPRSVHSFCTSKGDWDWRGRSRETQFRDHWPYTRTSRKRLLQHDLSLPLMEKTNFEMEGEDDIDRDSMMDFESTSQDAESYQDVVDLTEDRKPQDPVQDNMENYRKLLSLGVQLAEDDRHSHLTHGHSSRSKRSAYPSTSRGLKTMPEAKKSTHRRGICEDRSSHGVIMEKFIKDVSRNSKVGKRGSRRMLDDDWKDVSFSKRESVIQERGCEGSVLGGGFNLSSNLMSRKRVIERKRRYQLDTDGKGLVHNQKGYVRKKPFECSKMRAAVSMSSLSSLSPTKSLPADFGDMPYVCDECGRPFSVISEFVEHQIMHTRENLSQYGESFIHSMAVSEVQKRQLHSSALKEHKIHSVPFTESQKSHTITRPPDNEENERAFTISANPEEQQRFPTKESVCEGRRCERSVIHRLVFTDPQKSHSAAELSKPKVIAESTISSADAIQCQTAHAGESAYEGKVCGRSVIQSIVTAEPPRHHTGNELAECSNGESSIYISDFNRQQKIDARENPFEVAKYNKYTVIHSVSSAEPQNSPTVEGPSELKKDGESSAPNSHVREYQKARAKKKYIECCRDYKTSVIHSLPFGEPQNSVIRSLALTDPQTSYAEDCMRMQCKECGKYFATSEALGRHQKVYGRERFHGRTPFGSSVIRGVGFDESQKDESDDTIYECKDCGLGFAHFNEFEDHQKVHGREYLMDNRVCGPSVIQTCSFGDSHKSGAGDQLYECPQCGESFISNDFLFEHQKMHEMEPFFVGRQHNEAWMRRLPLPTIRKRRRSSKKSPPVSKTLRCQVCGQDFIHSSVLREHMKIHTGEDQLERGKTSEDTGAPGLRDHMRVHEKDEPFNYGATFVHTSFVSELPNTSSPFYECKDCGKSFIHSTILVKHQQLHLEEAAQEVEANFVVPQEVLRIQGSNVEAAEPEVEAAEPEVEAAEPNLEAAEPNGEAEGPDGGAAGPDGEAEQPSGVAEPPRGDADEPDGAGIEDPEERAEDPEEDTDEPDGAGIEDPEEEGGDQEIQVEEPYYDCRECAKTFTSSSAYGEHLKTHARVIIYEAGNVYGESSRYTEHASTSTSASDRADEKYFKCDVCGQLFRDRLSLARHQNSHTG
uniref:C2H2-type domain-containing protein n=1 Tax=Loxodonta africana TaxID=9785 RepID=G3TEM7_LOXAF